MYRSGLVDRTGTWVAPSNEDPVTFMPIFIKTRLQFKIEMNFKFCFLFQGHHFKLATLPSKPYVTDMTPTGLSADGSMKYEMTGMFAEILDNLQVSLINHTLVIGFGSS